MMCALTSVGGNPLLEQGELDFPPAEARLIKCYPLR